METKQALLLLAALAQPTRLAIYRRLVEAGPNGLSAGELASVLDLPASSASFHFKELVASGLVEARPHSRFVIYAARYDQMDALITFLTENCCRDSGSCTPANLCRSPPPPPEPSQ
ncbi:MAG: ArsR/SmtB family transcription factor [Thioalkalivibrionaceae bacterium]